MTNRLRYIHKKGTTLIVLNRLAFKLVYYHTEVIDESLMNVDKQLLGGKLKY